jgi:hypothetical protein
LFAPFCIGDLFLYTGLSRLSQRLFIPAFVSSHSVPRKPKFKLLKGCLPSLPFPPPYSNVFITDTFLILASLDTPDGIRIFERYASRAAMEAHWQGKPLL